MNMIIAARRIFDEQGVPRELHQDFLKHPMLIGYDCIKASMDKLRTRNTTWDHSLHELIQAEMNAIKPATLSLLDLQKLLLKTLQSMILSEVRLQRRHQRNKPQTTAYRHLKRRRTAPPQ